MHRQFKNLKNKEKGQGLVEYALILVLVAIVVIAALMILGPIIGNVFSKVNSSLSTVSAGVVSYAPVTGVTANDCTVAGLQTGQQVNYYSCGGSWYTTGSTTAHCSNPSWGGSHICP